MTVSDLRKELLQYPDNLRVLVSGVNPGKYDACLTGNVSVTKLDRPGQVWLYIGEPGLMQLFLPAQATQTDLEAA